jgi:ethanolamine utilization protein EutQ (cupin superfamily)
MGKLVSVVKASDINYVNIEEAVGEAAELAVIQPKLPSMGAGFAKFSKSTYDWQIKYDEIIYVISGSMFIMEDGEKIEAKQGDVYFMKEGADITYGTDDEVVLFYTLFPVNWREVK